MKLLCPSCGAEVQFKSNITVYSVCSFCKSMLVRHDIHLETLGKMAELPGDISPLQLGTRGQFEGTSFEIVGRVIIGWEAGRWNEWFVLFDNGSAGWLAEAQGFWMMSFESEKEQSLPPVHLLRAGSTEVILLGKTFVVDDIKEAMCVGSEGELPFSAPSGKKRMSVDLSGPDSSYACIDFSESGQSRVYVGKYVEFEDFRFVGLREFSGWT